MNTFTPVFDPDTLSGKLAEAVSESRLWQRHMEMGAIGATPRGGVNRLALTQEDAMAQGKLAAWAKARGHLVSRDEIGNVYVRREGTDPTAAPVVTGSHLDSQPTGGKYDGAYGVLAGLEVLEALDDAGIATRRPVDVVAWMNEEGSRFLPGAMGSGVLAGAFTLESALASKDGDGKTVAAALAEVERITPLPRTMLSQVKPFAYLEAHIEQGPRLEAAGATIGVVTGIQGIRRFVVEINGEEAHAGTTPARQPPGRDACLSCSDFGTAIGCNRSARHDPVHGRPHECISELSQHRTRARAVHHRPASSGRRAAAGFRHANPRDRHTDRGEGQLHSGSAERLGREAGQLPSGNDRTRPHRYIGRRHAAPFIPFRRRTRRDVPEPAVPHRHGIRAMLAGREPQRSRERHAFRSCGRDSGARPSYPGACAPLTDSIPPAWRYPCPFRAFFYFNIPINLA